jgi:general secretion pathway protein D
MIDFMPIKLRQTLIALTTAALVAGTAIAQDHRLNLQDAKIQTLIATVAEITGKNFVLDPRVKDTTVNVISNQAMTPDEIYQLFESILKVHGFAAVPSGDFIKIMPEGPARQDAIPNAQGGAIYAPDALITQVVEVIHVPAADLVPLLRPLIPQNGHVVAHPGSNSLVISDRAGNVERLMQIIRRIDTANESDIEVIPLDHANATEVVRTINLLSEGRNPSSGAGPKAIADERTNSVLLSGDPSARLRLKTLITHLDTPLESGGDTQVVYLRYASAEALLPILSNVASSLQDAVASGAEDPTNIQAHPETNALIISAPPAVFRSLASVIRQLDIRRKQVLVEAIIVEVSDDFAREIGVQWQAAEINSLSDSGPVGGTTFPSAIGQGRGINSVAAGDTGLFNLGALGSGLNLGYLSGSINVQTGTDTDGNPIFSQVPQLSALVSALDADVDSNVLSTPSIVTLDHQEAMINVGQEVPFVTGSFTNAGSANSSVNPFQTINREDVGLTLTVTPHINEGDTVILDIVQEVSNLSSQSGAVDLITNKREISTTVMVPDSEILVLGGLIDETVQETIQKVPALGDIPLLGNLFRFRSTKSVRRNLMIFIRPHILDDPASQNAISSSKYNYMRSQQANTRENYEGMLPEEKLPLLPKLEEYLDRTSLEEDTPDQ